MSRQANAIVAIIAGAVAVAALVTLIGLASRGDDGFPGSDLVRRDELSLGQSIYLRGRDEDGRPIPRSGGGMMGMMGRACAGCHGVDGRGRSTPMFTAPDITYDNLTDPRGMLEPDGGRGETFTDDDIRRAVVDGVDPEGKPLDPPMPRWDLSDAQVKALIGYLKTLP